jgi:hypothetical protein
MLSSAHATVRSIDPKKGAEVLFVPAPRPLPSLGLKAACTVAAGFFESRRRHAEVRERAPLHAGGGRPRPGQPQVGQL